MSNVLNGNFTSNDQARNLEEDLIATGIPQDNIFVDEDQQIIRVKIPAEEQREIKEIFDRHEVTY
jgi:hypothetical protein